MVKKTIFIINILVIFIFSIFSTYAICNDVDGLDYFDSSYVLDENSTKIFDSCDGWHTLIEKICEEDWPAEKRFHCDEKCINGACYVSEVIEYECIDPDGSDYSTASNLETEKGEIVSDFCETRYILNEAICNNKGKATWEYKRCPYKCEDGKCIEENENYCEDLDGNDIYQKSSVNSENGEILDDYCESANTVAEMICEDEKAKITYNRCGLDCRNGACRSENDPTEVCDENKILCYGHYIMKCTNNKWNYIECNNGCDNLGCKETTKEIDVLEIIEKPIEGKEKPIIPVPIETQNQQNQEEEIKDTSNQQEIETINENSEPKKPIHEIEINCDGCMDAYKNCVSIGKTVRNNNLHFYCSKNKILLDLKNNLETCFENYECKTGICKNNKCIDENLDDNGPLLKLFSWVHKFLFR